MIEFDSLPQATRSLILATLGLEIASANCRSIFELARKRKQTPSEVWRDACRKAGQQRCTMPPAVTPGYVPPDSSTSAGSGTASASTHMSAPGHAPAAAHLSATGASAAKSAAAATDVPRSQGRTIALAVGLGAILVIGIGLILAMPGSSDQASLTSSARPTEAVHLKSNETAHAKQPDTAVPAPQGTARRMEEINKAFSKR